MKLNRIAALSSLAPLAALVIAGCASDATGTPPTGAPQGGLTTQAVSSRSSAHVCPGPAAPGDARCHAIVVVDSQGQAVVNATPSGYVPADLQSAYGVASSAATGMTVAVVDAYDYPNAEKDLGVYRSTFGLPPCTTANGCFSKVNQNGVRGSYPHANSGWAQEMALDLDMVSAICPSCNILLVEASSSSISNLGAAVSTAARLGAVAISNSYGGNEFSGEASAETQYYYHPGIAVTASSGDSSYGVEFPAASRYVTAVGGTSLARDATTARGWTETAWSGAGSGCSAFITKPSWQTDTGCANRTVADVSADADPSTGVAVYETFNRSGGWQVFGGTSVASPIIASVYALALASNGASVGSGASLPYAGVAALNDVSSGSNGSCGGSYLCTAGAGYDGPTGLGTPSGTAAF